jgi:hypothetical protein
MKNYEKLFKIFKKLTNYVQKFDLKFFKIEEKIFSIWIFFNLPIFLFSLREKLMFISHLL